MDENKENKNGELDRDTWADAFFDGVVNGGEEKPKNPGIYGQFDAEKGEETVNDETDAEAPAENEGTSQTETEKDGDNDGDSSDSGKEKLSRSDRTTVAVFVIGMVLLILLGVLCGYFIGRIVSKTKESSGGATSGEFGKQGASIEQIEKLQEVFKFISENYYLKTDPDELLEGAVTGMVESIKDPYGRYHRPGKMDEYISFVDGKYTGIGTVVKKVEGGFKVTDVESGSSADKAGIKKSDLIVKIDGEETASMTENEVQSLLSKADTTFSLVLKTESGEEKTVSVTTQKLTKHVVEGRSLGDGIIYIRIDQFTHEAPSEFAAMLSSLKTEDAKALVLDLRDNPGGYVEDAAKIADMILPEGIIATAKDKNDVTVETYNSDKNELGLKLVVLVNGNSASAAELVTGAIANFKAGTVVGEKTFGKAVGQIMKTFEHDGSGLTLSAFRYFTPSGDCIDGIGIMPDVFVSPEEEYVGKKAADIPFEHDAQLQEALKVLAE